MQKNASNHFCRIVQPLINHIRSFQSSRKTTGSCNWKHFRFNIEKKKSVIRTQSKQTDFQGLSFRFYAIRMINYSTRILFQFINEIIQCGTKGTLFLFTTLNLISSNWVRLSHFYRSTQSREIRVSLHSTGRWYETHYRSSVDHQVQFHNFSILLINDLWLMSTILLRW